MPVVAALVLLLSLGADSFQLHRPVAQLGARRPFALRCTSPQANIDVQVKRDPDTGSFGIDVDQDNTVAYNSGAVNPELLLGDVIIAVNGEALDGRTVGSVLGSKEAPYTFTIERDP